VEVGKVSVGAVVAVVSVAIGANSAVDDTGAGSDSSMGGRVVGGGTAWSIVAASPLTKRIVCGSSSSSSGSNNIAPDWLNLTSKGGKGVESSNELRIRP